MKIKKGKKWENLFQPVGLAQCGGEAGCPTYRASSNLVGEGNYDEIHSQPAASTMTHSHSPTSFQEEIKSQLLKVGLEDTPQGKYFMESGVCMYIQ